MTRIFLNRKNVNPLEPSFTGEQYLDKPALQLFIYNETGFTEDEDFTFEKLNKFSDEKSNYWLNIHGIHDVELVKKLSNKLNVHNLAVQDILDVNQRPKMQEYDDHCFFSLKSVLPSSGKGIEMEQISFIMGKNFVVSFQEKKGDYFEHVRERIRKKIGILRERGADYLLFLLFESVLDNYNKTLHRLTLHIEGSTYIDVNKDPSPKILETIETFRHQVIQMNRVLLPVRDFISKICRGESGWIIKKHLKYFFELKDLCLSVLDECDKIESKLESSINLFFSIQGHRMNLVMKTLTIVATIFIPITFVAGVYGMNFVNIPELSWRWGYAGFWGVIIIILCGMIIYFKRKRWF